MKIENEFTVHAPIDQAWKVLTDLEGIAPCLPGAQLTGVDGDVYQGKVKIKVGPVISEFAGTARFVEKDDDKHRAVIDAKGRDSRSAGSAMAMITATLTAAGESTVVSVDTDMKISGKLAQFGSGMIKEVSQKLLGQFVASLEAKIAGGEPGSEPAGATTHIAGSQNVTPKISPAASRPRAAMISDEPEPLDLMDLAGGSIRRRLIPVAVGAAVVIAAIFVWRRRIAR